MPFLVPRKQLYLPLFPTVHAILAFNIELRKKEKNFQPCPQVLSPLPPRDSELFLILSALLRTTASASAPGCESDMVGCSTWAATLLLGPQLSKNPAAVEAVLSYLWYLIRNDIAYATLILIKKQRAQGARRGRAADGGGATAAAPLRTLLDERMAKARAAADADAAVGGLGLIRAVHPHPHPHLQTPKRESVDVVKLDVFNGSGASYGASNGGANYGAGGGGGGGGGGSPRGSGTVAPMAGGSTMHPQATGGRWYSPDSPRGAPATVSNTSSASQPQNSNWQRGLADLRSDDSPHGDSPHGDSARGLHSPVRLQTYHSQTSVQSRLGVVSGVAPLDDNTSGGMTQSLGRLSVGSRASSLPALSPEEYNMMLSDGVGSLYGQLPQNPEARQMLDVPTALIPTPWSTEVDVHDVWM